MTKMDSLSYEDGFTTGQDWQHDYEPGGPFRWHSNPRDSESCKLLAKESQRQHADWMAGFRDGVRHSHLTKM